MNPHGGAGRRTAGGAGPGGSGGSGGDYWTSLQNVSCDLVLRRFRGAVLLGHREPEPPHTPTVYPFPRLSLDEAILDAYCDFLERLELNTMFTVTISPDNAQRFCGTSLDGLGRRYAQRLVIRELRTMPWSDGKRGFPWPFFVAAEETPSGRDVAHCHGGLYLPPGDLLQNKLLADLRGHFAANFGHCRFELMDDRYRASRYGLKDSAKQIKRDPDAVFVRPSSPKHRLSA